VSTGEVGVAGLALSMVLVVASLALSRRQHLRLERDLVVAVARSVIQLLIVGVALKLVVDPGAWLGWSWLWVVGIVVFAAATVARRAPELPGVFGIALAANAASAGVGMAVTFGLGIFEVSGRTIVPVAGMLVGNAMKSGVVAGRRLVDATAQQRAEIEARLALGLPADAAARPIVRATLRTAISPQIENTKALGFVFLPGAMTGLILAGVDPVQAVLTQGALMYLILGGVVVTTAVTTLLAQRRLFTADHRLVPLARSTADE
jgi:putative ABC transport system permease protein